METYYDILLATHKESLGWLKYLPQERPYRVVVSNSNGCSKPQGADELILRDNFGREAGHYLHYIIEKYDSLPEVVCFLQGDPWPHAAMWGDNRLMLELLFGRPAFRAPMSYFGKQYAPSPNQHNKPERDGARMEHYEVLSIMWPDSEIGPNVPLSIGASFWIRREIILAKPKHLYEKLLSKGHDKKLYHADPYYTLAHTLEGCWGSVFDHAGNSIL